MNQTTLRDACAFEGVGLHLGQPAQVEVRPAAPNSGFVFLLRSSNGAVQRVPATAEYVIDTARATVLGLDGASVSTVEHLLSALLGMGVSNVEIDVRGPEIPALDGSAVLFADAIAHVGLVEQAHPRAELRLDAPFEMRSGDRAVLLLPSDAFRVRFVVDFEPPVGTQYFDGSIAASNYREEIAPARTFGYLHEVEALRARGLAMGGSLENALVFAPNGPMQPMRWPTEVVRHKVLDLIGDFALLGAWPLCDIIAVKSGHELHARVTQALRKRNRG